MFLIIATVMMAEYNTGLQRNTERRTSKGYIYKTKPIRDFKRSYANVLKNEISTYTDDNDSLSTSVDHRLTDTFSVPTEFVLTNLGFDHFSLLFYNPYIKDKAYQKEYKELRLKNLKYLSKYYRENFNLKISKNDNGTYNPTELDLVSVFDNLYHPSYKTFICENYAGSEYNLVIRCRNNQKCFLLMHQTAAVGSNFFWKNNVAIGKNTKIGVSVYLEEDVLVGNDCIIQDNVHIGFGTSILDGFRCTSNVMIGNRNIILSDVHINCNVEYELRLNQLYGIITGNKDKQVIGDGNTIEKNVSISTSKQIENGCIIEEGANVSLQEDRLFFTKVSNKSDCNYFLPDLSDSEELPVTSC